MFADFMEAVNRNSAGMNALFSMVVAIATVIYAVLTHRLVSETRRMRQVQTEPAIAIWAEPSEFGINFLNLVIENVGQGVARNIKLSASPDIHRKPDRPLSDLGLFKNGLPHLAPRQRIKFFLLNVLDGPSKSKGGDLSHLNFQVTATYANSTGATYTESFSIDISALEGFGTIGTPPLISIARDLERLQRDVGHLASGFRKPHVVIHTLEDVRRAEEEVRQRWEAEESTQAETASGDGDS